MAALEWRDVTDASDEDGLLIAVRRGKTNPDGETADVRFVKGNVASAVRARRERRGDVYLADRVVGLSAQAISERFAAAGRAAGIELRLTAHSGRVGLATELTARGASAHDVMRAGNWKTVRMCGARLRRRLGRARRRRALPVSAGGRVKTAVQLLLPEMDEITGFLRGPHRPHPVRAVRREAHAGRNPDPRAGLRRPPLQPLRATTAARQSPRRTPTRRRGFSRSAAAPARFERRPNATPG